MFVCALQERLATFSCTVDARGDSRSCSHHGNAMLTSCQCHCINCTAFPDYEYHCCTNLEGNVRSVCSSYSCPNGLYVCVHSSSGPEVYIVPGICRIEKDCPETTMAAPTPWTMELNRLSPCYTSIHEVVEVFVVGDVALQSARSVVSLGRR